MKPSLIIFLLLTLAAPMSKGDPFTDEITAGMKIIWPVPTNVWPPTNKIWSYKVVPQHFSDAVISNLMTIGSFTNDQSKPSNSLNDKATFYFGHDWLKHLSIDPALGFI
ncbi:MAG: hypothetical protein ACREFE_18525, partial [Limisphaerales bacterium]